MRIRIKVLNKTKNQIVKKNSSHKNTRSWYHVRDRDKEKHGGGFQRGFGHKSKHDYQSADDAKLREWDGDGFF